jgi:hypothetical protein
MFDDEGKALITSFSPAVAAVHVAVVQDGVCEYAAKGRQKNARNSNACAGSNRSIIKDIKLGSSQAKAAYQPCR